MKTVESSPRRLRLTHFGWYYAAIATVFGLLCLYAGLSLLRDGNTRDGLIFIGLGTGASVLLALIATRKVTITLDKEVGIVHVRNLTARGARMRAAPLSVLAKADMQSSNTGDLPLHRLVLHFHDRDPWIVTPMYTSGDGTPRAMAEINDWLFRHMPPRDEDT